MITHFTNFSNNHSPKHLLSSLCYQITARYSSSTQDTNFYIGNNLNDPNYTNNCSSPANLDPHHDPNTEVSDCNTELKTVPCPVQKGPKLDFIKPDVSLSDLKKQLSSLLSLLPSPKRPLVLILVGLDQIGNSFAAQIIESLPSPLPPGVKLILSASSNQTPVLQAVELHYTLHSEKKSGYACVGLGLADRKQCAKMLASLQSESGRRVTSGQQTLVNQALNSCSLTLYARLLHVHTSLWRSGITD